MKKKVFFYFLSPLLLLLPAIYNGYPLVFSDTGTYIQSGMELLVPDDRPIVYGLFLRVFSFGLSLWFVLYFQSLIVVYCLWGIFKLCYPNLKTSVFVVILFLLSSFSGLGWYSSQIMPDIFTVSALLSLVLILFDPSKSKFQLIIWILILIVSILVHYSNLPICFLTFFMLFTIQQCRKSFIRKKLLSIILVSSIFLGGIFNYCVNKEYTLTQGGHVFLMGKMLDSGVLESFLQDYCTDRTYIICTDKDQLPSDSRALLWDSTSPLYKQGGWKATKSEYFEILFGIITSPKHLFMYLYNVLTSSATQLVQIEFGSGLVSDWYSNLNSPPNQQVKKYFTWEYNQYMQSRQNGNLWNQTLNTEFPLFTYRMLTLVSLLWLAFIWLGFNGNIRNSWVLKIGIAFLFAMISNAIVTAAFANVYDRLQARVSWFVMLTAALFLIEYLRTKYGHNIFVKRE